MFGDESALIANVLQTFANSTRSSLVEMDRAVKAQDVPAIAALAHRITGACRLSGAMALGDAAYRVELAAKQDRQDGMLQAHAALEPQWQLLQAALQAQAQIAS